MKSDSQLPDGDPELIALMRGEIELDGAMTFARLMELALYHPRHGYYASGRARIGRRGDFFTNVSVGPIFGRLLAAQFVEVWEKLGRPREFTIVEQGAHDGQFAVDVLSALRGSDCLGPMHYVIAEPFPVWRERQQNKVAEFAGKISWFESMDELEPFTGVYFSNELFDALPVHLLELRNGNWQELFVTFDGERFELRIEEQPASAGEDACAPRIELNLAARKLMREIVTKLARGVILTIDYGFTREQFAEHTTGTLQIRAQHKKLASPLDKIGFADISAHVDWTRLIEAAQSAGAELIGLTDQHHFLTGILSELIPPAELQRFSPADKRALQTLLHPEMMGRNFQAIALAKNFSAPLSGFRFARAL